ncbi:MAG: hypothetical protein ACRCYS_18660 [Beijerinckiaceae bacterium]
MAHVTALEQVRALYGKLSMFDQTRILADMVEGRDNLERTDAFIDAMIPVQEGFDQAWNALDNIADPHGSYAGWERATATLNARKGAA